MEHTITVDNKEHAFCGQTKINRFRRENRFCDFIIKVESEEIHVHRNVICSHSDYFDAMFTHDTKEKRTGTVELKDVNRDCTVKCVDYMYTGQTCILETCALETYVGTCGELLHVATMFQLHTLCKAIAEFLEEKLDCTSFFSTRKVADLYNCRKLLDACNDFAIKNFQQIAQLEEFNKLDKEYIEFLVGSKNTEVSNGAKCKAVIKWTKQDSSNRKTYLLELLEKIDLMNIPLSYRRFLFENEPLIHSSCECMRAIGLSVFKELRVEKKDFEWEKPNTTYRSGIGVFDCDTKALQFYNVGAKKWTQKQKFNKDMTENFFSAVVLDQHLYVFLDNGIVYRIAYSDPGATWEKRANKHVHGPAVVLNGFIYIKDYSHDSFQVDRYDPAADRWDFLPDKTSPVTGAALATSKGQVFCIGGYDFDMDMNAVEIYDPGSSTWRDDNSLNEARCNASAATFKEGIYVMGGNSEDYNAVIASVEYRCPATETWTVLKPMKIPRQKFCSLHFDGKIYAVGGDESVLKTIEQYDPETEEWKIIEKMGGKRIQSIAAISLPLA